MTDSKVENQAETHQRCTQRFIELANTLKEEGIEPGLISHALMAASGIYATYTVVGNSGGLNQSGVDKLVSIYQGSLEDIQRVRKEQQRPD